MRPALLLVLLMVGLALSPPAHAHQAPTRPFKGALTSSEEPTPVPEPGCVQSLTTSQSGHATHLGWFEGTGETCAYNPRVVAESPIPNPGAPPYFVADFSVAQTWTAANGDMLSLVADDGVFSQSIPDGTSTATGTLEIIGGTGRFDGASGEADVTASGAAVMFDGWIQY